MRARLALSAALAIVLAANVAMAQSSSASGPHSIAPPMLPHLVKPGGSGGPVEPREAGIRCEQASAAKAGEAVSSPSQAAREKTAGSDAAVKLDVSCPADRKPRQDACRGVEGWSEDSRFLAVPQWVFDGASKGKQRLAVVCPERGWIRHAPGIFRVLRLEGFAGGAVRGIDSPVWNPRPIAIDVSRLLVQPGSVMHQREFERHSYVSTAQLLVGGRAVPCEVSDISLGGAMIRIASPLKQGAEVTLNIDPYGKVVGTAVWNREGLSGIKFTDSAELVGEILAAMASYSGA